MPKPEERVGPERRRNLRFPFSASIETVEPKSGTVIKGRTSDLGLGGCFMDSMNALPVGSVLLIKIIKETETFEAKAKVIYSLAGMGMGLAFLSASPNQVKLFQRWILELNGDRPAAPAAGAAAAAVEQSLANPPAEAKNETQHVLNELIVALIRGGTLPKADGDALLRRLNR
jgi:hypothetical protein